MKTIISKDNPRLKAVRSLIRSKKERRKQNCFVMEGVRALRALCAGTALPQYRLKEVWVSETGRAAFGVRETDGVAVPIYEVPHDIMEQLSDCRTSQGVLGVVEYMPVPLELDPERGSYLLLDRVMDPGNMGTLIRSAVAFGFEGVLLYGDCVDVFNPKTVRATMGALPFCNVWGVAEREGAACPAEELFQRMETLGYELIATELREGEDLYQMELGPKNVLVIGNEANGVCDDILCRAARRISIPMSHAVESLNAAVAGSICMSAMQRFQKEC